MRLGVGLRSEFGLGLELRRGFGPGLRFKVGLELTCEIEIEEIEIGFELGVR